MYGCNNYIKGCLSISANKIGSDIDILVSKGNVDIDINANCIGGKLDIGIILIGEKSSIAVKPIGERMLITCGLVCSVNKDAYLDVNPNYVWLTPDMLASGEFDIISNVDWIIN